VRAAALALLLAAPAAAAQGTVRGTIAFEGAPPELPALAVTDPACPPVAAEHVVVTDGGLRDVVVRLAVGSAPAPGRPPPPAVIDQTGCRYAPHVIAIVAGQKLAFRNSDPTLHNVHTYIGAESVANVAQPRGAAEHVTAVATPPGDTPFVARCDVHPWMSAYVLVTDHPHFAVTGADGRFRLEGVPPGRYTLQAWHPHLGQRTQQIRVVEGKTLTVRLAPYTPADYIAPQHGT
jgi:plastocyanin